MAAPTMMAPRRERREPGSFSRLWVGIVIGVAAASCLAIFLAHRYWPFEPQTVIQDLQDATNSRVQVQSFHRRYFPRPGITLRGVTLVHDADAAKPLATIDKLTIRGSYLGIMTHHVDQVRAEGLHIFVPPFGTAQAFHTQPSAITVGKLIVDGGTLEFGLHQAQKPPLRFDIHEATLQDLAWLRPFSYRIKLHNPNPSGEIAASGEFGAWSQQSAAETPISGEFKFEDADLSIYGGIAGKLSSTGKFSGNLGHINISGTTDTPEFKVQDGGNPVHLTSQFAAYVDATRGDTFLKHVDALFGRTRIIADGSIAKSATSEGKAASLTLIAQRGRIEDILGLFVSSGRSPMSGQVSVRVKVEIPPGKRPFLEKVRLRGKFGVGKGEFSNSSTQESVDKLSAGALGEKDRSDPATAMTDLTGEVALGNGVANFSDLSFGVPGATARLHGTYDVIHYNIDLHGQMKVQTKISNTNTGAKALLLRLMDPLFKKRKRGEVLPVQITGTYQHPSFGLDPMDKRAQVPVPSRREMRSQLRQH